MNVETVLNSDSYFMFYEMRDEKNETVEMERINEKDNKSKLTKRKIVNQKKKEEMKITETGVKKRKVELKKKYEKEEKMSCDSNSSIPHLSFSRKEEEKNVISAF